MYANGSGVAKSDAEAANWYRLAAEQGYALAQSSLGLRFANGDGVPRDLVQALMWLNLAAERGDAKSIQDRDLLAAGMSPAQIAEAGERTRERQRTTGATR
jgi:TPR repeat protein